MGKGLPSGMRQGERFRNAHQSLSQGVKARNVCTDMEAIDNDATRLCFVWDGQPITSMCVASSILLPYGFSLIHEQTLSPVSAKLRSRLVFSEAHKGEHAHQDSTHPSRKMVRIYKSGRQRREREAVCHSSWRKRDVAMLPRNTCLPVIFLLIAC